MKDRHYQACERAARLMAELYEAQRSATAAADELDRLFRRARDRFEDRAEYHDYRVPSFNVPGAFYPIVHHSPDDGLHSYTDEVMMNSEEEL